MKFKKEITVKINCSKEELLKYLKNNNFINKENYVMEDIYYVKKDYDLNKDILDILNNCILIRNIGNKRLYYVYKYKEYDENKNILKDGKSKVEIKDISSAKIFLENIGYKKFIKIKDEITVYRKDDIELAVEYVNDKHLYIEIEETKKYNTIDKLIAKLDEYNIDYDKSNYFVKKAEITYNETYNKI